MRLKLRTMLIAGFALIICLGLLIAFHGILSMGHVDSEVSSVIHVHAENTSRVQNIQTLLLKIEHVITAESHAQSYEDRYSSIGEYVGEANKDLETLKGYLVNGDGKIFVDKFFLEWNLFVKALGQHKEDKKTHFTDVEQERIGESIHALEDILEDWLNHQKSLLTDSIETTNAYTNRSRINMFLILAACLLVAFAVIYILLRVIQTKIGGDPDEVASIAERVAKGDLKTEFDANSSGVYAAIKRIVLSLEEVEVQANRVAEGDYDTKINPRSKEDSLSFALDRMNKNLKANHEHVSSQNWLKDGLNKLSMEISGDLTQRELAEKAICFLGKYLNVGRAVFFVPDALGKRFALISSYAYTMRDKVSTGFAPGEGLIGQVALEKQPILISGADGQDSEVIGGTFIQKPRHTFALPLLYESRVYGVIELSSLQEYSAIEQDFLRQAATLLGTYLFACEQKQQVQVLLEQAREAQAMAEEKARALQEMNAQLEEQQQKIQQQTEILQQANAQMEEQQQQLQQQTEELQQSNAQMEEQQQQLQQQQEELRQTNDTLMQAKLDLDRRATELEQSNRYKSEFLANMSHELRTPLNSILMLSKLLARNNKGNMQEEDIKKANVIHNAGEELLRLINDILDLSKIEAGKNQVHLQDVKPSLWEKELLDYFTTLAANKGLQLVCRNNADIMIKTDPDKVGQVLRNFVSNAIKFTHEGSVEISFEYHPNTHRPLQIKVRDTGLGIKPEQQKKIFEAFHQVDSSISREFGGTGLGLTIASRLAAMLDGEISLSSELGKGSEFSLFLPLTLKVENVEMQDKELQSNVKIISEPSSKTTASPLPKPIIEDDKAALDKSKPLFMIVEDDMVFASVVGNMIHSMGMQFVHAATAKDTISIANSYKPAGIIFDISMQEADGVALLNTLKTSAETKNIPIQIISSKDKDMENQEGKALQDIRAMLKETMIKDAVSTVLDLASENTKKLLIVEDNEIQRSVLIEYIRDENTEVFGAASQTEALEMLQNGMYDAVIVDLGLKQGSGLGLCKAIRKNKLSLPIIVYTGKDLSESEEKQIKQYADRIIIKTVNSVQRLIDELSLFLHKVKKEDKQVDPKPAVTEMVSANLEGKRILIVDDDIKNVFVLCSALEERGLIIQDAQNGQIALEMLRSEPFDLVLMDIMMPVMDGFTAMKLIREDEQLKHVPIIALTAKALKEDRGKCLEAGANDYIAKPVDYDGLFSLIQAWIGKRV